MQAFFQAVAMIASQEVDPLTLDYESVQVWIELDNAFTAWQEVN